MPNAPYGAAHNKIEVRALKSEGGQSQQELISRWDSERGRFYDDILHVEASAYAHWTDFLCMLIYTATNQGAHQTELSEFVLPK